MNRIRFALIVCGVLFALILAPIDGRRKYEEVLAGDPLANLLRRPAQVADDRKRGIVDPVGTDSNASPNGKKPPEIQVSEATAEVEIEDGDGLDEMDDTVQREPLACFPPADLLHKYDWARYHLRHLAGKSWDKEPAQRRPQGSEEFSWEEDGDRVDQMSLQSSVKRSDFNRELSADLYAQYSSSCACQTKYELRDLGYTHFPRYIVNAICQNRSAGSRKCWRGSSCKEIPYKVRVLTRRSDAESGEQDHHSALLPEPLREYWRFKTVTIAAACQCSV